MCLIQMNSFNHMTILIHKPEENYETSCRAKLVGLLGALHVALARPLSYNYQRVIIFKDNRVVIRALNNPEHQSGHIIITDIVQTVKLLRSKNI